MAVPTDRCRPVPQARRSRAVARAALLIAAVLAIATVAVAIVEAAAG